MVLALLAFGMIAALTAAAVAYMLGAPLWLMAGAMVVCANFAAVLAVVWLLRRAANRTADRLISPDTATGHINAADKNGAAASGARSSGKIADAKGG